jgi:hypothetical protein
MIENLASPRVSTKKWNLESYRMRVLALGGWNECFERLAEAVRISYVQLNPSKPSEEPIFKGLEQFRHPISPDIVH